MINYGLCSICLTDAVKLLPAPCAEKPETVHNIGMYHCPDCGLMLLAGVPHFLLCKNCVEDLKAGRNPYDRGAPQK